MNTENGRGLREEWRWIDGYATLYEVSNAGRVRSHHTSVSRILSPVRDRYGYLTVLLYGSRGRHRYRIHQLVCTAFHGDAPGGAEVAHIDGSKSNNVAENLRWASRVENSADKIIHGTHLGSIMPGERHPRAKLTGEEIQAIRASVEPHRALGRAYGVDESTIRKIRSGKRWSHDFV